MGRMGIGWTLLAAVVLVLLSPGVLGMQKVFGKYWRGNVL